MDALLTQVVHSRAAYIITLALVGVALQHGAVLSDVARGRCDLLRHTRFGAGSRSSARNLHSIRLIRQGPSEDVLA